ncbi:MAG: HEAT repeat domain-containing protein [Labilithrix sp.]|nr:HEAT repeat domain-containing protein [Labilithrix sp.]
MGLFDLFKSKGQKAKDGGEKKANPAAKWAEAAASKRAQAYDRQEAIAELCKLKSAEGVEALMRRFTFATDPSITDQEEKEAVFEGIVSAGREAIEPVRAFAGKAESLGWPTKILKEILTEEELVDELLAWLSKWDTEYAKFIDPKLQILASLEEYESPKIRAAVEPFLQDANEQARHNAVAATLAQKDPEAIGPLLDAFLEEESMRVKIKIAEGFSSLGWEIPEDQRDAVRKLLPYDYSVDGSGIVKKKGS